VPPEPFPTMWTWASMVVRGVFSVQYSVFGFMEVRLRKGNSKLETRRPQFLTQRAQRFAERGKGDFEFEIGDIGDLKTTRKDSE